jgi:uncharacterized protein with HEPN domain
MQVLWRESESHNRFQHSDGILFYVELVSSQEVVAEEVNEFIDEVNWKLLLRLREKIITC